MNKFKDNFIWDDEKMLDFINLSKDEFLQSYSYLTEEEYDATANYLEYLIRLCTIQFIHNIKN